MEEATWRLAWLGLVYAAGSVAAQFGHRALMVLNGSGDPGWRGFNVFRLVSFVLGFIPPSQLKTGDTAVYVLLLALAVIVLSLPPFVFALVCE